MSNTNIYHTILSLQEELEADIQRSEVQKYYQLSPAAIATLASTLARTIFTKKLHKTSWRELSQSELQDKVKEAKQTLAIAHHYIKKQLQEAVCTTKQMSNIGT